MSALINLLPDSKQARLKAQRTRRLAVSIGSAVLIIAVAVPIILVLIKQGQSLYLNRTQSQIEERKKTLKETENIVTMLTVKDHLNSLVDLYDKRIAATRLLSYLPQVMPQEIRLANLTVDAEAITAEFTGTSTSYASVQKFQRALEQANVKVDDNRIDPNAALDAYFKDVVLESVGGPSGNEVTFTITASFSQELISKEAQP